MSDLLGSITHQCLHVSFFYFSFHLISVKVDIHNLDLNDGLPGHVNYKKYTVQYVHVYMYCSIFERCHLKLLFLLAYSSHTNNSSFDVQHMCTKTTILISHSPSCTDHVIV